jgi:hypothetical protein
MKRQCLTILAFLLLILLFNRGFAQNAQWSPATESFEGGTTYPTASGWVSGGSWTISNAGGHTGTNFARLASGLSNKWLFSQGFTALAGHTYFITYWDVQSTNLQVFISTSQAAGGANMASNYAGASNATNSFVFHTSSSFTCTVSGTYYWAFYVTTGAAALKLDDISCYEDCSLNTITVNTLQTNVSAVTTCYDNAEILCIPVTAVIENCATVSSFTINANGSTNVNDIKNAKIWYTGLNSGFSTSADYGSGATLFGTVASPTTTNFSVAGTQTLKSGTNYFWLTFDVKTTATTGDVIDAECTSVNTGSSIIPATTAPAGNRSIGTAGSLPASFRTCSYGTALNAGSVALPANTFTIPVSGAALSNPLGAACNLREVRVKFFGGSNEQADKYTITIKSPDGTSMVLFSGAFPGITSGTLDARFRYSSNLTQVSALNYGSGFNAPPEPFNQGFYCAQNNFSIFNGKNPLGKWEVVITESAAAGSDDYKLDFVELVFGPAFTENDVRASGDNCASAVGLNSGIYLGSTAYNPGPTNAKTVETWDPSTTMGGCNWNASNDNSQWFAFIANKTKVSLSISGLLYDGVVNNKLQSIVVENQLTPCSGSSTNWNLAACPIGGSYPSNTGTYANHRLDFNAVIGNTYYLVIDGTAGGLNNFYIDIEGASAPATYLPVQLTEFKGNCDQGHIDLEWQTASESNNDYFILQKSPDGVQFTTLDIIQGHGNSNNIINYAYADDQIVQTTNYYRLKQVDYDGASQLSAVIAVPYLCNTGFGDGFSAFYNHENQSIEIEIAAGNPGRYFLTIADVTGRIIHNQTLSCDNDAQKVSIPVDASAALYLVRLSGSNQNHVLKIPVH